MILLKNNPDIKYIHSANRNHNLDKIRIDIKNSESLYSLTIKKNNTPSLTPSPPGEMKAIIPIFADIIKKMPKLKFKLVVILAIKNVNPKAIDAQDITTSKKTDW